MCRHMMSSALRTICDCGSFKLRVHQYVATLGVIFATLSASMHYGWASKSIPLITSGNYTFRVSNSDGAWLVTMVPIGSLFGNIAAANLINLIGRKKAILFSTVPLSVSWIVVALAPNWWSMLIGRLIGGISDGALFTSISPYLSEISDPDIRGLICSIYPVAQIFGLFLINLLQTFLSYRNSCYIACAISLVTYLIAPWVPESPYFYLMKDNRVAATVTLQKFRGRIDVSEDLQRISNGLREEQSTKGSFIDIFKNRVSVKALMIALLLQVSQQLLGLSAIISYSSQVFEQTKNIIEPNTANLIFFILFLLGSVLALFTVDYSGRKALLVTSLTLTANCLLIIAISLYLGTIYRFNGILEFIQLLFIILYPLFYSAGMLTVPLVMASEILPSHVKAVGLSIVNLTFCVTVTFAVKYFEWSSDRYGVFVPFLTFGCCSICSLILILFVVPETKNKTLEDIQIGLRRIKQSYGT